MQSQNHMGVGLPRFLAMHWAVQNLVTPNLAVSFVKTITWQMPFGSLGTARPGSRGLLRAWVAIGTAPECLGHTQKHQNLRNMMICHDMSIPMLIYCNCTWVDYRIFLTTHIHTMAACIQWVSDDSLPYGQYSNEQPFILGVLIPQEKDLVLTASIEASQIL